MGEVMPDGTIQGYSCARCGAPCNIQGNHRGECVQQCSMCETKPAETTWGFPVCWPCSGWLSRLDDDLTSRFGYSTPPERYIDRAKRAIRQRRALAATTQSDESGADR